MAAAFGFRYQYLITVEELLDLFEHAPTLDWRVGVDLHGQDSADILVYPRSVGPPSRAVQVKASMTSSVTKMDLPTAKRCLDALASEHAGAANLVLLTNRTLGAPAAEYAAQLRKQRTKRSLRRFIDVRQEDVRNIVSRLLDRIARVRARGKGGLGQRLHYILLAQLIDLVLARGSQTTEQIIDYRQVADILDESAAVLADASGQRSWGRAYGMPLGTYVPRPAVVDFLAEHLTEDALHGGSPAVAVLSGLSGSGKSAAVASWASARREHYAVTVWVDATSDQALAEQTPELLEWLGAGETLSDDPAQIFCDVLAELPVPWLLILDGALDSAELSAWIPASGYGHVVITTSRGDWPIDIAPQRAVKGMEDADAIALIRQRLPAPQEAVGDDETALRFATRLGRWPLAIDLACAWVRGLGGDHTRLQEFVARLDRLDLLKDETQLGSYPRNVSGVIRALWEGLSPPSRAVLGIVIISGGAHVPLIVIDRWAASLRTEGGLDIDSRAVLDELAGAALLQRRLRSDVGNISGIDEALYVHEGIQAILSKAIATEIGLFYPWMETYAGIVNEFLDGARLVEASALLPAAEKLLIFLMTARVAEDDGDQALQMMRVIAATMMHNLGTLATLTGLLDAASMWLRLAVNTREELVSDQQRTPVLVATQIQTLAALAQVVFRQSHFDEIQPIVEESLRHLNGRSVDELEHTGFPVLPSLRVLSEVTQFMPEDSAHLREQIDTALKGHELIGSEESTLQRRLLYFNSVNERGRVYAITEQWTRAVDSVLTGANQAVSSGMLVHDAVTAVLDTGLALMHSRLERPHSAPAASWTAAINRLAEWGEGNIDSFDPIQCQQLSILVPCADQDVPKLRAMLDEICRVGAGSQQVQDWVDFGEVALKTFTAQQRFEGLLGGAGVPDGVRLIRTIDGGSEVRWWPVMMHDQPLLAFVTVSASMYVGEKVIDPLRDVLIAAGFPDELDESGHPRLAVGWSFLVEQDTIILQGPQGKSYLEATVGPGDPHIKEWWGAVNQTRMLRVIYRDAADLTVRDIIATKEQALVRVLRSKRGRWWKRRKRA
ncbi:hypothetical protein [Nocardiopsis sp. L17-MgMaSL7]|uniref:hypothetical protein n=1 Tax=Nocardiopsis sp. L17-MgMaSL7 TaxID=1938893 RepID=UPI0011B84B92|nr:hypothetical protein [Nocardiopsis sp. L17-MgMaSL7]